MTETTAAYHFEAPTNPGELARMTRTRMVEVMTERFGPDATSWSFVCDRCRLVQSPQTLEQFGSAAKSEIGRICQSLFAGGECQRTMWTKGGGPLTIRIITQTGEHIKPSFMIAPADTLPGSVLDEAAYERLVADTAREFPPKARTAGP